MAQYVPFAPDVQVNGETVLTTVNSFPEFMRPFAFKLLSSYGIENPVIGAWYSQKAWLDSFREITEKYGTNTLFEIGKNIPANAKFPHQIDTIEKALSSIDIAYHNNHKGGEIGFYKLISHDTAKKELIMHCKNPYPCDFDRGIIAAMARKFKSMVEVTLDKSKPSRKQGADESWYIVKY